MKVAIVEDDSIISKMYKIQFEAEHYAVETAENGKVGLELIEKMKPDVILLDLLMPEMTGDEMLVKLRQQPWGKNIKVIVLTNLSADEAPPVLKDLHIDEYIIKAHHTPKQVLEMTKHVLEGTVV